MSSSPKGKKKWEDFTKILKSIGHKPENKMLQ